MRGRRAWARPARRFRRAGPEVGSREENGEGSAWPLCSGLPLSRRVGRRMERVVRGWRAWARPARRFRRAAPWEGGPGRRGNPLHQFFFRKISPAGLAIPFSRLRVSPAPEMAHLMRPPLSGSRPAPWKPDSAMLCADRPALVARGDPNFESCRT